MTTHVRQGGRYRTDAAPYGTARTCGGPVRVWCDSVQYERTRQTHREKKTEASDKAIQCVIDWGVASLAVSHTSNIHFFELFERPPSSKGCSKGTKVESSEFRIQFSVSRILSSVFRSCVWM
jgi:hypothetical protein